MVENRWALLSPVQSWWSGPRWINFHPRPSMVTKYAVCAHQFSTQKWPKTLQNALHQTYLWGFQRVPNSFPMTPTRQKWKTGHVWFSFYPWTSLEPNGMGCTYQFSAKKRRPKRPFLTKSPLYETNLWRLGKLENSFRTGVALQVWGTGSSWIEFHPCPKKGTKRTVHSPPI